MRANRKRRARAASGPDDSVSYPGVPFYEVLPESHVQKIQDATFKLMREIGVAFDPDPQVLDLFSDAGCEITSDNVVRFDRGLVEQCLATVSKSAKLWNRDASHYLEIKEGVTSFIAGMTCIKVFDIETGEKRDSTREDIATIARVVDALPNIDGVCVPVKDVPNSTLHGEIGEFVAMAENTTKPLEYLCEDAEAFDAVIDMAATIRGGMEQLAEKPYFTHIITPLPLYFAKTHSDQVIRGAECGIPVTLGTISLGGASTPYTIAGCMTHSLATDFAGITLSQLVRKGSFCHGSSENRFMEPATGGMGNVVPDFLADTAMRQVRSRFGLLPLAGGAESSRSRYFNQDAVHDISMGTMRSFYMKPDTLDYVGSIDAGISYSLHALLLENDLAGMLRCMWKGIPVDDEHLALNLTRDMGPRGNYFAEAHTVKHCRDNYWDTRYFGTKLPASANLLPDQDLIERIDDDLRDILSKHQPEALPQSVQAQIRKIHAIYEGR